MLDIKFIGENADLVKAGAKKKKLIVDIDKLLKIDETRRALLVEVEGMRAKQNETSDKVAQTTGGERMELIDKMKKLKEELQKKEKELEKVMHEWQLLMVQVPNVPDPSVPDGDSDADNKEVKVWGEKPQFDFEAKSHIELMQNLDMA